MIAFLRFRSARHIAILVFSALPAASGLALEAPRGTLETVDGDRIPGRVTRIDNESVEMLRDDGTVAATARADALRLDFQGSFSSDPIPQAWVLAAGGDRLAAVPQGVANDRLIARWTRFPERDPITLPLEVLRGSIVQPPVFRREFRRLLGVIAMTEFDADTFFLTDDSRLSGELAGSGDLGWPLETSIGRVEVEPQRIRAVAFNSSLIVEPERSPDACLVALRDGSWITFESLVLFDDVAVGPTPFGEEWEFAASEIQSIRFSGPRVRPLEELEPDRTAASPYLAGGPALTVNHSILGGYLTIQGREFSRGLGMTSGAAATWKLAPEDRRFQATVGIDDAARGGGSVRFVVELDGRTVYTSELLQGGAEPVTIGPLTLAGASELTLRVDYGEYGDIRDFADWCSPLLLR